MAFVCALTDSMLPYSCEAIFNVPTPTVGTLFLYTLQM
jgi:hypothetical protein